MRAEKDARYQHTNDAGQPEPLADRREPRSDKKNKREGSQHTKASCISNAAPSPRFPALPRAAGKGPLEGGIKAKLIFKFFIFEIVCY